MPANRSPYSTALLTEQWHTGHETTLSGALGGLTPTNSYHVVSTGATVTNTAVLDRFTITGGKADGTGLDEDKGAGLLLTGGLTVSDCIIKNHLASANGGGVYMSAGSVSDFTDCTFDNNDADNGAGLYAEEGTVAFTDCVFVRNSADNGSSAGSGGAVYVASDSLSSGAMSFLRCNINNNDAQGDGGAIYLAGSGIKPTFTNCLLYGNEADSNGTTAGGAIYTDRKITLLNCTLAQNICGTNNNDGGIKNAGGNSRLRNCILWANEAGGTQDVEADQIEYGTNSVTATYTCIQNIDGLNDSQTDTDEDPKFKSMQNSDYELDPIACDDHSCTSKSIDRGSDNLISETTDLKGRSRKVNLDNMPNLVDMGPFETQSNP